MANTSEIVSRKINYRDFDLRMLIHPNTQDIIPLKDLDAVRQSVRNIVLTSFGEKLFKPEFGGNVAKFLFENVSPFTALVIQSTIEDIIRKYEKRVDEVEVIVNDNIDSNAYDVSINFRVINTTEVGKVNFELNRLR